MGNFVRWTAFSLAVAAAAVAGSMLFLMLSRLYGALQSSTFVFALLVAFSVAVTLAAIGFASKLDDEAEAAAADEPRWREDEDEDEPEPDPPIEPEPEPRPGS